MSDQGGWQEPADSAPACTDGSYTTGNRFRRHWHSGRGHARIQRPGRSGAAVAVVLALFFSVATAAPSAADPDGPSKEEVEKSQQKAEKRADAVEDAKDELAAAKGRLDALSADAQQLLRKYYRQQVKLERARKKYEEARERLEKARRGASQAREAVGRMASQAYQGQTSLRGLGMVLRAKGPQDALDRVNMMRHLARERSAKLDRLRSAKVVADVLRKEAEAAFSNQQQATRRVEKAKEKAQTAVRKQRQEVDRIRKIKAERAEDLDQARQRARRLERDREEYLEAIEEARQSRRARQARETTRQAAEKAAEASGVSDCASRPVSLDGYSNGLIPPQALCPLPQDGHMLRADAAAAFMRLNNAYASAFGEPICVTDSYRDLATQQYLYETKPALAAEPGTSNHGWGVAVDLCGGINNYDTETHQWMRAHAPDFGWILPEWARADGSMPEPWHWEYTG